MRTYEKIETVFNRDTVGTKKLILGNFRNETVEFLKDVEWMFTEKSMVQIFAFAGMDIGLNSEGALITPRSQSLF